MSLQQVMKIKKKLETQKLSCLLAQNWYYENKTALMENCVARADDGAHGGDPSACLNGGEFQTGARRKRKCKEHELMLEMFWVGILNIYHCFIVVLSSRYCEENVSCRRCEYDGAPASCRIGSGLRWIV